MGLSEGFVPVGLKEHGGIMYVISANKDGVGEIGTIPSPILKLDLRSNNITGLSKTLVDNAGPVTDLIPITDFKVYPGEKFLPLLYLDDYVFSDGLKFIIQNDDETYNAYNEHYLISTVDEDILQCAHDGLYQLKLYSAHGSTMTELKKV